jgi:cell volume regulation protein A
MLDVMNLAILAGAGLVFVTILTSLVAFRIGAPLLLVFLLLGLLVGEGGLGLEFDNAPVAYFVGSIALAIILFDSGFETSLRTFKVAAAPALLLATLGVLLTSAFTAVGAHLLFGLPWLQALLMGAVVGSTDAAAVFFLLRVGGITLRERVRSTLEIESASNDPMAIFLTLTLVTLIAGESGSDGVGWAFVKSFGQQFGLGAVLGLAGGWLIVQLVNRVDLEQGLFPLAVLTLALVLFAGVNMLGGSGFLAVYIAGLLAGNAQVRGARALRRFQEGMTWLSQITMFLTLGLFATPSGFLEILAPATALGLGLAFVARPLAIWLCLLPFGFSRNETTFIAWVGLRGAVSILLAILPLLHGLPGGQAMFNATFLVVLSSLMLQGWTVRPAARWLGLVVPPRSGPIERVELELPGTPHHELAVYRILPESPVAHGRRLPRWARPALIVREGRRHDVHSAGRLQPGDHVYIFALPREVRLLDRIFASPAELRPDDREFFGDFVLDPKAPLAEVAKAYGFAPAPADEGLSVGELVLRELGGIVEIGDRFAYGPVELIVSTVDEEGRLKAVGLALEPTPPLRHRLPLFQTRREIAAVLRRWWRRRRGRGGTTGAGQGTAVAERPPQASPSIRPRP